MTERTYNGWKNYATWRINLEILDDPENMLDGQEFNDVSELASYLEDYVDEIVTDSGQLDGIAVDYARAFVSDVDFWEIAEAIVADFPQVIATDDDDE